MRVYGYIRVSTDEQAKHGVSPDTQRAHILAYAELQRVKQEDFELVDIIQDLGASAKNLKRPGMGELLALMRERRAGGVIVAKLDRLTRNLGDWSNLIKEFFDERGKVRLFSVAEEVNTTKATGRMMLNIIMTIAQWEREIISERTAEGMQTKIRTGEWCGKVRYGFRLDESGPKHEVSGNPLRVVEDATEQETIRLMRSLAEQGRSLRAIGQALEILGITTRDGNEVWTPATISKILKRTHTNGSIKTAS
jgi:DNA invertase Pin-like site-specific DNA recombinase